MSALLLRNAALAAGEPAADLLIRRGVVAAIAPRLPRPAGVTTEEIDLGGAALFPGLINAHDHLEFNLFPALGAPPYPNYIAWAADVRARCAREIDDVLRVPLALRLLWGAYKNLFAGVTTVVHHNDYYRRFRWRFPLRVVPDYTWAHSLELDRRLPKKIPPRAGRPFMIHIAEGTDALAAAELGRLRELGGLTRESVLIHGIAFSAADIGAVAEAGAAVVWCPASNARLYGATTPAAALAGAGVPVAIGTDSAISGGIGVAEQLRCARLAAASLGDAALAAMVTTAPAAIFGLGGAGTVAQGAPADLLILREGGKSLAEVTPASTACVMRAGRALFGDRRFRSAFGGGPEPLGVDGEEKLVMRGFTRHVAAVLSRHPGAACATLGLRALELDPGRPGARTLRAA